MELTYCIKVNTPDGPWENSGTIKGVHSLLRLHLTLPEGRLESVTASLPVKIGDEEKIFMNGYQTWTCCPEYGKHDRIRSLRRLPKKGVQHFGLDRYGDEHFLYYPDKRGQTHGESWCYFRDGKRFRLFGSLDERPGYTIFRYDAKKGVLSLERDCAGVRCGGDFAAFDLFYAEGGEDEVFDGWFAAMGVQPRTRERLAGYSSWYNRYQDISAQSIMDDLNGCARVLKRGDLFQIDDGWEPFVGDWLSTDAKKFPEGLRPFADAIHKKGLKAGLWLAPFVAQTSSRLYHEHRDWFLLHEGEPWYCGSNWDGFYALDIDNPDFVAYLERTFDLVFNEWHFDLVKLDFLYAAAPYGNEKESRAGRMIRAMELLRRLCGDKLILGCGVPVMPAFGLVDYCRVSCDVGLGWDGSPWIPRTLRERVSTRQAIGNSIFRRQLNGRAYLSDPDVFFLREDNIKLTWEQKRILATVNSLFGGVLLCSDNMSAYTSEARAFYDELLRLRDAEDIEVHADGELRVSYRLDGETRELLIPD